MTKKTKKIIHSNKTTGILLRPPNPKRVMVYGFPGDTPPLKPGYVHPPRYEPPHEDDLMIIYPDSTP